MSGQRARAFGRLQPDAAAAAAARVAAAVVQPAARGLTAAGGCGDKGPPPHRVPAGLFEIFAAASFQSIWYWVLHVVVWTLACYRTLGVPHDMLLRARRLPEIEARVDTLARLASERMGGIHDRAGVPLAGVAGFALAALAAIGFASHIEFAQAAFLILLPLSLILYSKLRLALAIRRHGMAGPELLLALARRRMWHQFIGILAMLAAAVLALGLHVSRLPPL